MLGGRWSDGRVRRGWCCVGDGMERWKVAGDVNRDGRVWLRVGDGECGIHEGPLLFARWLGEWYRGHGCGNGKGYKGSALQE